MLFRSAFVSAYGLFTYAPYLAVYVGTTAPFLGAVAAGIYGMLSFSESQFVNSITLIKDGGDNHGKLDINVGLKSSFAREHSDSAASRAVCSRAA